MGAKGERLLVNELPVVGVVSSILLASGGIWEFQGRTLLTTSCTICDPL